MSARRDPVEAHALSRAERFAAWDGITPQQLSAGGGMKWSLFPGTLGAWVAESDLGTAPAVTAALHEAVERGDLGYLPRGVSRELSRATAGWLVEETGWDPTPERVHPIADVIQGLDYAITHYTRPGSAVVVPTPAYMPFLTFPASLGREVVEVPHAVDAGRHTLDLDAIDAALAAGAGLVLLCNPLNPGGRVFERAELEALAAVVERHGARVFSDEIHAPIVFGGRRHVPYASVSDVTAHHTVTAISASKAWNLPGVKCAQFITSNDADEEVWQSLGPMASHGASTLGVIANTAAYDHGREWLADVVDYIDGNLALLGELLADRLPEVGYRRPEGTYIAWLDASALGLGEHPATVIRERGGVSLTEGTASGRAGAGHVRMILATPRPLVEQLVDGIARAAGR
ncbi:MAG: aminotransferase class I/II-fold pyridoxal phosphate-dependent enzyme [Microcella sp.]|uniref:MalY/PatB family protein n=1 Tax=Microcella sp. TaxID=1913979 RepID=UPI0033158063